eukprot:TRINITY_DN8414_c0_g1_i4.p1 TRINITY_DN8414_c0_g1~~TRINITY_DN8414_c0_g1_i4.p1  ORF type:complete len:322 (+),score=79.59 TRINITY_DN8414_c0_g1_i4:627-1592(+)
MSTQRRYHFSYWEDVRLQQELALMAVELEEMRKAEHRAVVYFLKVQQSVQCQEEQCELRAKAVSDSVHRSELLQQELEETRRGIRDLEGRVRGSSQDLGGKITSHQEDATNCVQEVEICCKQLEKASSGVERAVQFLHDKEVKHSNAKDELMDIEKELGHMKDKVGALEVEEAGRSSVTSVGDMAVFEAQLQFADGVVLKLQSALATEQEVYRACSHDRQRCHYSVRSESDLLLLHEQNEEKAKEVEIGLSAEVRNAEKRLSRCEAAQKDALAETCDVVQNNLLVNREISLKSQKAQLAVQEAALLAGQSVFSDGSFRSVR